MKKIVKIKNEQEHNALMLMLFKKGFICWNTGAKPTTQKFLVDYPFYIINIEDKTLAFGNIEYEKKYYSKNISFDEFKKYEKTNI